MRVCGLSTINLGNWEIQHAWGKRKFIWENRSVFDIQCLEKQGSRVMELEANNIGHVVAFWSFKFMKKQGIRLAE
jgi:hypothetical protein